MRIGIIAAVSTNGVIGRNNKMPWHMRSDLRRFKRLTMGHTVIMGRRTYESVLEYQKGCGEVLVGRKKVVITTRDIDAPGISTVKSLADALKACEEDSQVFIVGGAMVYRAAIERVDRLLITHVNMVVEGDTFMPPIEWSEWKPIGAPIESRRSTFQEYTRVKSIGFFCAHGQE